MQTEKISITDDELLLIINSINFRMKKVIKHKNKPDAPLHEVRECDRTLDALGPLGYKLRMMRKNSNDNQ